MSKRITQYIILHSVLLHLTYSGMGHVVQCKPTMHFPTQKNMVWSTSVIPVDHVNFCSWICVETTR